MLITPVQTCLILIASLLVVVTGRSLHRRRDGCAKEWMEGAGYGTGVELGGTELTRDECVRSCYRRQANGAQMPDGQTRGDCYCIKGMAQVKENPILVTTYIEGCDLDEVEPEPEGGSSQTISFMNALLILPIVIAFKT